MKDIILIGDGGHSKVIQSMIKRIDNINLSGILDHKYTDYIHNQNYFYDSINNISKYKHDFQFVVAIGDNEIRKKIVLNYELVADSFITIIDPTAIIAEGVQIGLGTVVMPGTVVNPGTTVGNHTILNTRSVIEHDNHIGDFVHISPNATLAGTVTIRNLVHIGASATLIPNTIVNENSIVGAGAVVINDIESNSVAVGMPAKIIKRRQ